MRRFFFVILCNVFFQGCHADIFEELEPTNIENVNLVFSKNVESIQELVKQQEKDGIIDSIVCSDISKNLLFRDSEFDVVFYNIIDNGNFSYPDLSIIPNEDHYCWTLAGDYLLDEDDNKIAVNDVTRTPSFNYVDGLWYCTIANKTISVESSQLSTLLPIVEINAESFAEITFPSGYLMTFPLASFNPPIVPLQSFYKDVFLDAGIGLTSRKFLYAAQKLGLSLEGINLPRYDATAEDEFLQNSVLAGTNDDTNGRLLYPDGQPRYRLLFVNGGSSKTHGKSLSDDARNNMVQFVKNGGSYVGTCAGAFFASNGYDGNQNYPYYLSIWPSLMNHTGIVGGKTGMFIENSSCLLDYYDFGGDNYVSEVRHNKGGYPNELPDKTEVLARYDYPEIPSVHLQPSVWAYKNNDVMGRIVLEGSHPEEVSMGEQRDLMAAMMQYAMDGVGSTTLKGFLQNGIMREMKHNSCDRNPSYTKIGDMQCHHFITSIPKNAINVAFEVNGTGGCVFQLALSSISFAYPDIAEYKSKEEVDNCCLFFERMKAGLWYVTVQCLSTVDVVETGYGQAYYGKTSILNGVPYIVKVSWDVLEDNTTTNVFSTSFQSASSNYRIDGIHINENCKGFNLVHNGVSITIPR